MILIISGIKIMIKKIFTVVLLTSSIFSLTGCSELEGLLKIVGEKAVKEVIRDNISRGPTGGGAGGGIIIVEEQGQKLINKKYDLFLAEGTGRKKIASGMTNGEGEIIIAENDLTSEQKRKISTGKAEIVIEVYDKNNQKTAVNGRLQEDDS